MIRSIPMTICAVLLAIDLVCDIRGITFFRLRNSSVIWKYLRYIIAICAINIFLFTKEFDSIREAIRSNDLLYLSIMAVFTFGLHKTYRNLGSHNSFNKYTCYVYAALKYIRWLPLISWFFKDYSLSEIMTMFFTMLVLLAYMGVFMIFLISPVNGSTQMWNDDYYYQKKQRDIRDYYDNQYKNRYNNY